jgi:signal transduction histidine kinase
MNEELRAKCEFLERSNSDLRDLQRRKQEVLATLVHDIKNPAAVVRTMAELLQSYDLGAQDTQRFVAGILETSSSRTLQERARSWPRGQDLPLQVERPSSLRCWAGREMNRVLAERKQ